MTDLTVIVPFFDETAFIDPALASVRAQGIEGLQLIVVNDNPEHFSQDHVARLIAPYDAELVCHPENLGLSAARNTALDRARGRYVAFLDGDDYYTPGGLARHLDLALSSGADMVHAQTLFTRPGDPAPRLLPRDAALFGEKTVARGLKGAEAAQFITSSWSSLYSRAFLDRHALRFDPEQRRFEDRLFVLQTVTRAHSLAFLGSATRVWRGRAGSISSSATTPDTHLLQVQLLEKCQAHMQAEVAAGRLPPRFEKRELFNTVSRLIWDLDVVDALLASDTPLYADLAARIPALLGDQSFGHQIFADDVLTPISRVGMKTRKGRISRTDFFALHRCLREGDFAAVRDTMQAARPAPAPRPRPKRAARRLVLHLGLHKTGTTYLQNQMLHHRRALLQQGILFPETGLSVQDSPLRPGATAGHQGLINALRKDDPVLWASLGREIRNSRADTVVISCENMLFPTAPDRDTLIPRLIDRLSGFDDIQPVAMIRRADAYVEHFWREWVADGAPMGAQSLPAFLVDHGARLTDLPALFAPIEAATGTPVGLCDYDAARDALWPVFCRLCGLPDDLPAADVARYSTPDRETIEALRLINAALPSGPRRHAALHAWLSLNPVPRDGESLLDPETRRALLDRWAQSSADFAAARGLSPARPRVSDDWQPFAGLSAAQTARLVDHFSQSTPANTGAPRPGLRLPNSTPEPALTIRLRPWAANLLRRLRRRGKT